MAAVYCPELPTHTPPLRAHPGEHEGEAAGGRGPASRAHGGARLKECSARTDAIVVRGLQKTYGDKRALDGVDLTVSRGEVFALLGPNGAGKTTTVEILEGYRRRDGGEVSVLGTDPANASADWRGRVGIVLQGTGEFEDLRVDEVVGLFAGYYPRADHPDHVTGFGPEARREFWDLIRDLAGGGTTILLTTHYLQEAEELANRVGVIANGRMIAVATPGELGGRAEGAATVSWHGPDGPRFEKTETPTAYVSQLSLTFDGGEIPGLTVTRPTLEDSYLAMIDAAMIDAATIDAQGRTT